jgi:hypothetical protein
MSQRAQAFTQESAHDQNRRATAAELSRECVVDAALGQLLGFLVLGLVNQVVATVELPSTARLATRALHHAYDLGQLLLLGVLSFAAVRLFELLATRLPLLQSARARASLLAATVLGLGCLIAPDDVSNLALRLRTPAWLATLLAALAFALVITSTVFVRRYARSKLRPLVALTGLSVGVGNALLLNGDYFACHFMAAWFSALVIGYSLEGLPLPALGPTPRVLGLATAAAAGLASVLVTPSDDVRLRLYALPSSVLAPLVANWLPDGGNGSREHVPAEYNNSPWFRDRSGLPPVGPTRAIVPKRPPIVMFFTVDAFRADVLERAEYRKQLPELTALREQSAYFSVARSPTASTMTTMASIFAGKYYTQLRWGGDGVSKEPLVEKEPRFPELLLKAGVRTMLIAGTLGRIHSESGVARGFSNEITLPKTRKGAALIVDAVIQELSRNPVGPLFIYGHFIEPHAPYDLAGKRAVSSTGTCGRSASWIANSRDCAST